MASRDCHLLVDNRTLLTETERSYMAKREYFYYPDIGSEEKWGFRFLVDPYRDELIFPVFSDEEAARQYVPDKEPRIMRETWKQCQTQARRNNCVGLLLDPPQEMSDEYRDKIQYLDNPKESAHHYLRREGR